MAKRVVTQNGKTYEYNIIEINGLQPQVANEIKNIANNLGISISEFLRPKLRELRDSYPINMRQSPDAA